MVLFGRAGLVVSTAAIAVALVGCAGDEPSTEPDPAAEPGFEVSEPTTDDCLTSGPWSLDLPDYAQQAESFMVGLGIPMSDFTMEGQQTVTFTADGLMAVETDITSAGTLQVPGVGPFPISTHSTTGGSGDWAMDGPDTLTITNWSETGGEEPEPGSEDVDIPIIDFSTIPSVDINCQPGMLTLVAPDSPFVPIFTR